MSYVIAPGPQPVSRTGKSSRYAWTGSTGTLVSGPGTQAILSLTMTADGSSDYEIACQAGNLVAGSGKSGNARLAILIDGSQADAISLNVPTSGGQVNCGWTYYTSGAQGTTMTPGSHVIDVRAGAFRGVDVGDRARVPAGGDRPRLRPVKGEP